MPEHQVEPPACHLCDLIRAEAKDGVYGKDVSFKAIDELLAIIHAAPHREGQWV